MRLRRKLIILVLSILCIGCLCSAQTGHGITLTWVQSTTPNVTANTVYYSTVSGGPYTSIAVLSPSTTYNVPMTPANQGTKACFVVTATATGDVESLFSPETCNTFPVQTATVSSVQSKTY